MNILGKGVTFIIEITSPSSARKDKLEKFYKYEKAGVKGYWIVESEEKFLSVFVLGSDSSRNVFRTIFFVVKPFGDIRLNLVWFVAPIRGISSFYFFLNKFAVKSNVTLYDRR
ncbi:MAG: hypothetical protein PWQ60_1263 [Thermoanaerobacteraceae bacterium]|nr:hypothetical protein [Thermoanaerobacteraceae bacterium]